MRLAALCLLLPLAARAADPDCIAAADRVAQIARTCASAKPIDCIPDLVLALRTGSPAQASKAAELLANQPAVTVALGWALASKNVSESALQKVEKALQSACDAGEKAACRVKSDALAKRAGKTVEIDGNGELTPEAIQKTVKRYLPLAERCYTRHLKCEPDARGKVKLVLRIDETGNVSAADVETGISPDVDACVLSTVARWRFPAPTGGDVRVTFPIIFATAN